MDTVLGGLVLGDLLEDQPRPDPLRVLERGGAVAQLPGDLRALEEGVPGRERVLALGELHPWRSGMDVPQHLLPEQRDGARVTDIEGDLDCGTHAVLRLQMGTGDTGPPGRRAEPRGRSSRPARTGTVREQARLERAGWSRQSRRAIQPAATTASARPSSSSPTGSIQNTASSSSSTSCTAMCAISEVDSAPCQCSSRGGIQMVRPGSSVSTSPSRVTTRPTPSVP